MVNSYPCSAVTTDQRNKCYDKLVTDILATVLGKGKPTARWGRKAAGLFGEEAAGLPKGDR
jgi:hypothetical protein